MFRSASQIDSERTASGLRRIKASWESSADSWFDGSVDSVDRRIALCERLIHKASAATGRLLDRPESSHYLKLASDLQADHQALSQMRRDLIGSPGEEDEEQLRNYDELFGERNERRAAQNICENCGKSWKACRCDGARSSDAYEEPDEYEQEWLRKNNPDGPENWDYNPKDWKKKRSNRIASGKAYEVVPTNDGHVVTVYQHDPYTLDKVSEIVGRPISRQDVPRKGEPYVFRHEASKKAKRWIELESRKFMADNEDAVSDLHELRTRAANFAALKTSTLPIDQHRAIVAGFVARVNELGRIANRPLRQASRREATVVPDFHDSLMFID